MDRGSIEWTMVASVVALIAAGVLAADEPLGPAQVEARARALARARPDRIQVDEIGRSFGGRAILRILLAFPGATNPDQRPAVLIVGGLDGEYRFSSELALVAAETLAATEPGSKLAATLAHRAIHVIPLVDPDGAARAVGHVWAGFAGNDRAIDRDRDGASGEDGPADLDGDGEILWIRHPHPEARHFPDPRDPFLPREAVALAGERGVFRVVREGYTDDDHDGATDEDPPTGVVVNRNFPNRFERYRAESGAYPTSEPETLALVRYVVERPAIELALSYGLDDNLVATPGPGKPEGNKPLEGIHPDDHPLFAKLGERYREVTQAKGAPRGVPGGTFQEWMYHHRGRLSLAVRGWHVPPEPPPVDPAPVPPPPPPHPDRNWLLYARALGRGIKEWTPYVHPTLGAVEIGGLAPWLWLEPPPAERAAIALREAAFAGELVDRLCAISLAPPKVERLADGVYRIAARITNEGWLPTAVATGQLTGAVPPLVVELVGECGLLGAHPAGLRQHVLPALAGMGGSFEAWWLVRRTTADKVTVVVRSGGRGHDVAKEVELR